MEIDTRHCPNCGHDTLDWDVPCPGCEQVPWDTPIGHRVISRRRFWDRWSMGLPLVALLVLVVVVIVVGNVNLTSHLKQRREREQQTRQVSAHVQQEMARLLDTSRFEGPWKAEESFARAIAPYEAAVQQAQATMREAMRQADEVVSGPPQVSRTDVEQALRRYQAAVQALRWAWADFEEARHQALTTAKP